MADKICPDCKGKKGKWRHTHSSLNPAYPHIFIDCETCHGEGTVPGDKIRKEFEETAYGKDPAPGDFNIFELGYKSRDKEVEKWRIRNDKQEAKIIDQEEEIKKLKNQLSRLESHMGLPDLKGGK